MKAAPYPEAGSPLPAPADAGATLPRGGGKESGWDVWTATSIGRPVSETRCVDPQARAGEGACRACQPFRQTRVVSRVHRDRARFQAERPHRAGRKPFARMGAAVHRVPDSGCAGLSQAASLPGAGRCRSTQFRSTCFWCPAVILSDAKFFSAGHNGDKLIRLYRISLRDAYETRFLSRSIDCIANFICVVNQRLRRYLQVGRFIKGRCGEMLRFAKASCLETAVLRAC